MRIGTLAVVGVGLLGGSVALAARRRAVVDRVIGVDCDAVTLEQARRRGLLDTASTDLLAAAAAELIVFCTPVDRIAEQVRTLASHCRPGTILTDVGSTKAAIVRALAGRLPPGVAFVGSHPLAGSEKQGHTFADMNLFEDRCVLVTPGPDSVEANTASVERFWRSLGAKVRRMTPEDHDSAMAWTSHLPHLVASALAGTLPPELISLTATGFRDTTRLASGSTELWTAIFRANRDSLLEAMTGFVRQMEQFRTALVADDSVTLATLLRLGQQRREELQR